MAIARKNPYNTHRNKQYPQKTRNQAFIEQTSEIFIKVAASQDVTSPLPCDGVWLFEEEEAQRAFHREQNQLK